MSNRGISGSSGYLALGREATPGGAVKPTHFIPMEDESLTTELNANTELLSFGSKAARLMTTPGMRSHGGDITILAEPNSTALLFDALLPRTSVTSNGDGTHTWLFNSTSFDAPSSYTVEVGRGIAASRFAGLEFSEISPTWKDNRQMWKAKAAALKSFESAEITAIAGSSITLSTNRDTNMTPTDLLLAGDVLGIYHEEDGTTENVTVQSKTATTITLTAAPSAAVKAGDKVFLRPQTVVLEDMFPFLWSRTEFLFADTAALAMTTDHTPVEDGSEYAIQHPFEDDKGAQSSGSFDPTVLVRTKSIDATIKAKNYYENDSEAAKYESIPKRALVVRSFSEQGSELRITFNNLACTKGGDKPSVKVDEALFYEREYVPNYDRADGQMLDVKVICKLSGA